ncbi:MAG TPA: dienelactone hydrolase family protein [Capillimicrobium sp.]
MTRSRSPARLLAALALALCALAAVAVVVVGLPGDESSGERRAPEPPASEPDPRALVDGPAAERLLEIGPRADDGYPVPVRQARLPRPDGTAATGLLLVPPGERSRMPAVIYLHGTGVTSEDFLFEAVHMAARGAVVLSLDDGDVGRPAPPDGGIRALRVDHRRRMLTVADVRRAVDALAARPDVDAGRIAFVGFSRGANTGALVAAREPRLAALVFIAGGGDPGASVLGADPAAVSPEAQRLAARIDPDRAVARDRADRPRLVQYGLRDEAVPADELAAFAAAVPQPRRVQTFDAGHPIDIPAMRKRLSWLTAQLDVEGPAVRGAPTVPPLPASR